MSRGTKLQRMEEDVTQSKTAVNANAAPGDSALPKQGSNAAGVKTPVSYTHLTLPTILRV